MPNWDFGKFGLVFRKNQPRLMADRLSRWNGIHYIM